MTSFDAGQGSATAEPGILAGGKDRRSATPGKPKEKEKCAAERRKNGVGVWKPRTLASLPVSRRARMTAAAQLSPGHGVHGSACAGNRRVGGAVSHCRADAPGGVLSGQGFQVRLLLGSRGRLAVRVGGAAPRVLVVVGKREIAPFRLTPFSQNQKVTASQGDAARAVRGTQGMEDVSSFLDRRCGSIRPCQLRGEKAPYRPRWAMPCSTKSVGRRRPKTELQA